MSKDILQTLKETYAKHYILKEYDQKTDIKSINDVIRDINVKLDKSWLNKSERRSGIEKRISEILSSVQIAVDNNDDDALHSILTSEVTPLYAHVRTLERQPQKYMGVSPTIKPAPGSQLFSTADAAAQRTADKKASAAAPKGLAKLAARIAKGKQEQPIVADPDVKIDPAILAQPKQTNLDSLETFIVTNKADISEEGFAFAMNAIQAAKADPSPENIEAAKAAVGTAADGESAPASSKPDPKKLTPEQKEGITNLAFKAVHGQDVKRELATYTISHSKNSEQEQDMVKLFNTLVAQIKNRD